MARLVEACVERVEFIVDVVLGMLYVDVHGKGRPSRAVRERGSSQQGKGNGGGPRARRNEPGPRISWGCAGNRRRSRRGPRCRVRTGSGLCGSRLFPHQCAVPAGGIAETVSGGHGPHGRRAGRRSGVRATVRARTASTIREVPGAGNRTGGETRQKAGNRGVSRQLAASGRAPSRRTMRANTDRMAIGESAWRLSLYIRNR